ncbi:MAG: Prolyl endopeptidase [Planctomycetaceae bacterium]|nr:Prolyl endopeptidase [Planctomycetaceae bacterium]
MPPETKQAPVSDSYHGVTIQDNYRWLENWDDKQVRAWSDAQNVYARTFLDRLPHVTEIRKRVTEVMTAKTVAYYELAARQGTLFAVKREPPKQQPFLIVIPSLKSPDTTRVLVDPNLLDPQSTTSIDWYVPSPDGRTVAVSLSKGGTESGDIHFFATETGKEINEVIPHVNTGTAGGDLVWTPDGTGVFYTRHPRPGERAPEDCNFYQQIYFHQLGTATQTDRYELGKDFPRIAETEFEMHDKSGTLLARVQNGDGGEFAHYLRSVDGKWTRINDFRDQIVQATFGPNDDLYVISRVKADRGKILRLSLAKPQLEQAETIIPEDKDTVVTSFYHAPPSLVVTQTRLYLVYQLGGPSELRVFDLKGTRLSGPEQLPLSAVGGLTKLDGDNVLFSSTSYVSPPTIYHFDATTGRTEKTWLASPSPVDFSDVEVVREFATSKDGTRIPVNILRPKNAMRDGSNPTVLNGYGGYGTNITPGFSAVKHVLLEQGFVYAVANLRGGGEYGEPWHRQGNLTNKQNVFDDFEAAARHLIARGYTSPAKLAIEGGSNGGLLMGATLTQHPNLMRAVVSHVGIYDMLRVELSPNGVFNIVEFGTVKDPDQFRALHAYSPYHHVQDGVKYPPVLFLTGANDPRVDPLQSRKMTARLQAATGSAEPILLRTSSNSGHGGDTALSEKIEQTVDVFAFLFDRLGVKFHSK